MKTKAFVYKENLNRTINGIYMYYVWLKKHVYFFFNVIPLLYEWIYISDFDKRLYIRNYSHKKNFSGEVLPKLNIDSQMFWIDLWGINHTGSSSNARVNSILEIAIFLFEYFLWHISFCADCLLLVQHNNKEWRTLWECNSQENPEQCTGRRGVNYPQYAVTPGVRLLH